VVGADRELHERLRRLARTSRMVVVAGLPGTGKSLLLHQLAHVAAAMGRAIHLLQWDVARPAFEASPAGRRYPVVAGVTHPIVRRAVGLWARRALVDWERRHPGARHLLIGEAPFVGHRLIELARRLDDAAEPLLSAPSCRFVVAVPSAEVRRLIEAERERRAARPLHALEREDAPPEVLQALWRELVGVARRLGGAGAGGDDAPYDPDVYRRVYERLLRHRHVTVVPLDVVLPTGHLSVYDFDVARADVVPSTAEARAALGEAEALGDADVSGWWVV
jgi:hypothetical protein